MTMEHNSFLFILTTFIPVLLNRHTKALSALEKYATQQMNDAIMSYERTTRHISCHFLKKSIISTNRLLFGNTRAAIGPAREFRFLFTCRLSRHVSQTMKPDDRSPKKEKEKREKRDGEIRNTKTRTDIDRQSIFSRLISAGNFISYREEI